MKPKVISFLAPAGGAGRTTAVMALASALVEEKGFPPLVIDATPEARLRPARDTTLGQWQRQMYRTGVKRDQLLVRHAGDPDELTAIIEAHVGPRFPDYGMVLIDTGPRLDDLALLAADCSDLIIVPFMDALAALRISEALDGIDLCEAPLYGLRCGDACNEREERAVSAAFTAGRLFVHGIPYSPQLADISVDGHLFTTYTRLICEPSETLIPVPARDFIRVRSEIDRLLDEIRLALNGYELRKRTLRPRRNPLPLHKLAGLLPT
ncbi:ParA family protein [Jannaschia pohangensis]|uniref:CobQ/CobB/MinD/ParA nucleotide binding domain-containing protein n=1 Tax=Jannaschia pohangensis TaxID=390807 RepID=A0A1I3UX99_9RHOB|nr:ParA family protein [Jannaschia pohangensis]SFJ86726.1 CobQ/CobB/MinD/ParA nucleotide binding domain-containing protein [Jannaschia pohangensis]